MSENDKHRRAFDAGNGPTPPDHASENSGFQVDPNQPVNAELLSAYLDIPNELQPETRRRIEQELAANAEARRTLHELEAIVNGLQALPDIAPPRSYHLTPEMVGAPEPVKLQETKAWYVRHSETVRWATAAAAILFIFVFTADLVTNGIGPGDSSDGANVTSQSGDTADEPAGVRSADEGASGGADADDAAEEAEMQPVPEDGAASDSGDSAPTATPAPVEAEEESAEDAGGGADAQESAPQDDAAVTSAEAGGEVAESEEETPVTLEAPEEAATEAQGEAVPDRDEADTASDDDAASDTGATEAQEDMFTMAAEDADEGGSDSRTVWRAAEFSLIIVLALLLTIMIILPRLGRMPPESRGRRR